MAPAGASTIPDLSFLSARNVSLAGLHSIRKRGMIARERRAFRSCGVRNRAGRGGEYADSSARRVRRPVAVLHYWNIVPRARSAQFSDRVAAAGLRRQISGRRPLSGAQFAGTPRSRRARQIPPLLNYTEFIPSPEKTS